MKDCQTRWELSLTGLQREVLFAAATWRDSVCRELDEGTGYVLPRSQLITLAQHMPAYASRSRAGSRGLVAVKLKSVLLPDLPDAWHACHFRARIEVHGVEHAQVQKRAVGAGILMYGVATVMHGVAID
eukprot:scaffold99927_cov21-Tisochrysis_lutea.AAC.3